MTRWWMLLAALATAGGPLQAQIDTGSARPKRGADGPIPLASILIPGLGQYLYGDPAAGLVLTATAVAGTALGTNAVDIFETGFPRGFNAQLKTLALHSTFVAAGLSGYDAFRRGVPALQRQGKYPFLTRHESTGRLLTAPFDPSFLKRWTTWIHLAYTGLVTAVAVAIDTEPGDDYLPFKGHDGVFAAGLAAGAALPEEAIFRGWLLPYFRQHLGSGTVLPNALQAGLFGALHIPNDPGAFLAAIAGWAFYEGWVTQRNGGSVRESIFHHFWYDAALFAAALATETGPARLTISLPIRF